MPKVSETTVPCGNRYCNNKTARVDAICGKFISSTEDNCEYLNYSTSKPIYSLILEFSTSDLPEDFMSEMKVLEEVVVDLTELGAKTELSEFVMKSCVSEYGESMSAHLVALLASWRNTFGVAFDLNPDPQFEEGPRFVSFELTLDGNDLQIAIVIAMYLKSHQFDMLEWYPESLAQTLVDEEDLMWIHEGVQITLNNVEAG